MQNVYIIGSKGIPARYGGFETFVENLTGYRKDKNIQYHVACLSSREKGCFVYNQARCFRVRVPKIGPARAVLYDLAAFRSCLKHIRRHDIQKPIIYILACRIGPFLRFYRKNLEKYGGRIYVNPDGHEWQRGKWNRFIRKYWKLSEKYMIKNCDLAVCDSRNIESYIREEYAQYNPRTVYIAYGAETDCSAKRQEDGKKLERWYEKNGISWDNYYLMVGRFVPENNYETVLREFHRSKSKRPLVIITKPDNAGLLEKIMKDEGIAQDSRIRFAGTVYDSRLLEQIRKGARAYIHGHEVGGTNPSLLEALGFTQVNLLLNVGFNQEVAEDTALYWDKSCGSLADLIGKVEAMSGEDRQAFGIKAKARIESEYSWRKIVDRYESIFD